MFVIREQVSPDFLVNMYMWIQLTEVKSWQVSFTAQKIVIFLVLRVTLFQPDHNMYNIPVCSLINKHPQKNDLAVQDCALMSQVR